MQNNATGGKIDLHLHSTASDGTRTPREIVFDAENAGLNIIALTDHDTFSGFFEASEEARRRGITMVSGMECSCKDEHGKYHILGYHFSPDSEAIRKLASRQHDNRMHKLEDRLVFLQEMFGFSFSEKEIQKLKSLQNPGKPHIGNLMVQKGYARTRDEAIRKYLNQYRSPDYFTKPEEAIHGIREAGGIAALAHAFFGDGDQNLDADEVDRRLKRFIPEGLGGIECFYPVFSEEQKRSALRLAEENSLFVTAGSDYHGANKANRIGVTGFEGCSEMPEGMKSFLSKVME